MSHCYRHLRLDERETIFRMKDARLPVSRIAAELGRHPSTIYCELRRNSFYDDDAYFRGYFPTVAHRIARRRRIPGRKLARNPVLANYVVDCLRRCWSPEQIAGRLRIVGGDGPRVIYETIYQYVYGPEGKQQELYRLLPWSRRRRRPRRACRPRGPQIPAVNAIHHRPAEIAHRRAFGHWEGDLVQFRKVYGKANLTSLVERKSRYAMLWRNPSRSSAGVMAGICTQLGALPHGLRQTVTFDRGTEFAAFPTLRSQLGMEAYFCEPTSPWQNGGVENLNGRIRRPSMRFVAIKSPEQQAELSIHRAREMLVRQRTQLTNAIRSLLAEFGTDHARGIHQAMGLIDRILHGAITGVPAVAVDVLRILAHQVKDLQARITGLEKLMLKLHRENEVAQRLAAIPGFGVITAGALAATVTDPGQFRSGRQFAAWLGLTPLSRSSGGKERLGRISKMGDKYIRRLLVVGMTSLVQRARIKPEDTSPWLLALMERKPTRLITVALANKAARVVWALLVRGDAYRKPVMVAAS